MLLRARSYPWAEHWARGVSGGSCDEFMSALTKSTIRTKSDGLEADVQALFRDDPVRAAFFGSSVGVCAGGTHLTRQYIQVTTNTLKI